ncbi:phosphatase PAP2 family protein [Actinokineospora sp.]|uniref:phosphatase PAP2 family protein n=1 Tax=Actinokineospora sp. TaxID=1872133 RepID=UPI0040384232
MAGAPLERGPRVALLAVLGPVVTAGLNTWVLKPIFGRTHDGYLAYPSGHTATLVSILAVVTLVVAADAPPGRRAVRTTVVAATALVLVAVAASAIVGLRYHYVTDTIGALFWAVGAVVAVAAVIDFRAGTNLAADNVWATRVQWPSTPGVPLRSGVTGKFTRCD